MSSPAIPDLTAPAPPVAPLRELDRSLLHGIAWTSGAKWAGQLFAWASTLIVARLLTPEDYGLVGMASIYLALITLLSEFGLGSAIITLRDLSDGQVAQLNGLAVLFGVASCAVSCAAAIPLGHFFHAPQLPAAIVAMSAGFVITGFKIVPFALLQRDMRFKALALIDTWRAVLLAVGMIAFALVGLRYWTLVIGGLLSSLLATGAILVLRRVRLAWPRRESLGHAMTFSRHVLVGRLSWYVYSNADFLVAGRILGRAALGLYDVGWTLANIPLEKITSLVSQVTPAVFSAVWPRCYTRSDSPASPCDTRCCAPSVSRPGSTCWARGGAQRAWPSSGSASTRSSCSRRAGGCCRRSSSRSENTCGRSGRRPAPRCSWEGRCSRSNSLPARTCRGP